MSKGLEYIRDISYLISENYSDKEPLIEEQKLSKNCFLDYCKYIEKELQRLGQIDNAKPSEAIKCLEKVNDYLSDVIDYKEIIEEVKKDINTIKQALIKAQEQEQELKQLKVKYADILINNEFIKYVDNNEKVLEIAFNKECDMRWLKYCIKENIPVEKYNNGLPEYYEKLTEEEFDLLKEVLQDETN